MNKWIAFICLLPAVALFAGRTALTDIADGALHPVMALAI